MRAVVAMLVLFVAYVSLSQTMATAVRRSAPQRAHALAPGDGRSTARLAQTVFGDGTDAQRRTRGAELARAALLQDPTAVQAASILSLNAQFNGNAARGRRLLVYSQSLSRRDFPTQIMLIEAAVQRGDVAEALQQYDVALRTSRTAPDVLFPILAAAISNPNVLAATIRTLSARPSWGSDFIIYVGGRGADPRATARLFTGLVHAGVAILPGSKAETINLLVAGNFLSDAWALYLVERPGADRRMSRDPAFTANIPTPSPFDWVPVNEGGISTSIQRGDKAGMFDFAAPPSVGGVLLRQMQMLPPGDYRLRGRSGELEQPVGSLPYWVLSCRDGREFARVVVPNSSQAKGVFEGRFSVPSDCPVQILSLIARASDRVSGITGKIISAQLRPIGGRDN